MENAQKKITDSDRDPYICKGCGSCFTADMAEAVYDLECPNCEQPLYVDDF